MRNLFGGVVGSALGITYIWYVIQPMLVSWPEELALISFLIEGAYLLDLYIILSPFDYVLEWSIAWLLIGVFVGIFSSSKWNTIRTALWAGMTIFILVIAGVFIQDPTFWQSVERNIFLIAWFIRSAVTSMIALISGIPILLLKERLLQDKEKPPPEKIETICDCGAIYKSNPLICAECGAILRQSAFSGDTATK